MRRFEIEEVQDLHHGESACILGNGPSLKKWTGRLESIGRRHLLFGTNKSWTEVVSPYHFAIANTHWTHFARGQVPGVERMFTLESFLHKGRTQPQGKALQVPICFLKRKVVPRDESFDHELGEGTWAKFVPWVALQCGLVMGIETFFLLGIDEHDNEGHHHDEVKGSRAHHRRWWEKTAAWLREGRNQGIEIYNANADSAVRCFPFASPL
ncbi:MAG: hypothetical protein GY769_07715 [bacterium]|nr:hypothetical protein [bacterium]